MDKITLTREKRRKHEEEIMKNAREKARKIRRHQRQHNSFGSLFSSSDRKRTVLSFSFLRSFLSAREVVLEHIHITFWYFCISVLVEVDLAQPESQPRTVEKNAVLFCDCLADSCLARGLLVFCVLDISSRVLLSLSNQRRDERRRRLMNTQLHDLPHKLFTEGNKNDKWCCCERGWSDKGKCRWGLKQRRK